MSADLVREFQTEARHADEMAAVAQYWMSRAQQLEKDLLRTKAILVAACGGQITVPRHLLENYEQTTVEVFDQPWDDSICLRTKV